MKKSGKCRCGKCTHERGTQAKEIQLKSLLSRALKAICLTRDYVGEDTLPAIEGWEWYDAGKEICKEIPNDAWVKEFWTRVSKAQSTDGFLEPVVTDGGCLSQGAIGYKCRGSKREDVRVAQCVRCECFYVIGVDVAEGPDASWRDITWLPGVISVTRPGFWGFVWDILWPVKKHVEGGMRFLCTGSDGSLMTSKSGNVWTSRTGNEEGTE